MALKGTNHTDPGRVAETRVATNSVRDVLARNYTLRRDDSRVLGLVGAFRAEYEGFFSGGGLGTAVTQLYWHRLQLHRRRLGQLGLDMQVRLRPKAGRPRLFYFSDGRYVSARVEQGIHCERCFSAGGRRVGSMKHNQEAHYMVVESEKHSHAYVCPNCGAVSPAEQLLEGCAFCGTKFQMEDFGQKVSSFALHPGKKLTGGVLFWVLLVLALLVQVGRLFYIGLRSYLASTPLSTGEIGAAYNTENALQGWLVSCLVLGLLLLLVMLVKGFRGGYGNHRVSADRNRFRNRVRVGDPRFSIEAFESGLENKLVTAHFSQSPEEVAAFLKADLARVLPGYQNLADASLHSVSYTQYDCDSQYHRVALTARLDLLALENGRLQPRREDIEIELKKSREQSAQQVCETVAYQCNGCGAPISLLEGRCHYCGGEMDLIRYDWVITRYEVKGQH